MAGMSIETARAHLARFGRDGDVIETSGSSATVELAAAELGVEPARIAKTLAFHGAQDGTSILVVTAGDAKVNSGAFKRAFGVKARMVGGDDVQRLTGHAPGGVCPFANPDVATVHLDASLRRFSTLFPAVGNSASAIELTPEEIAELSGAVGWVDVATVPVPEAP